MTDKEPVMRIPIDGGPSQRAVLSRELEPIHMFENEPILYQVDASSVDALQKSADEIKPAAAPSK